MHRFSFYLLFCIFLFGYTSGAQSNLLLNGGFEDVNTCVEYKAECGVEGWFYLKDVKAQMLSNETSTKFLGNNSFGIFYNWAGYMAFTPVIGTILPCWLQAGKRYYFTGLISARLHPKLDLKAGICLGETFYVPNRPFSKDLHPDSIGKVKQVPNSNFFSFEYSFIATGKERYLTFGTFIHEDTSVTKKKLFGAQSISLMLDNFQLVPEDKTETYCEGYGINKQAIYNYDYRHKEMDYSLYGKGMLNISFPKEDSLYITREEQIPPPVKPDTLKMGDVFFDFNKAKLKPSALKMLDGFFKQPGNGGFDSIYVEGHTDSIGSDQRNLALSLERCESIRQWLIQNAIINASLIQVHPFGRSKPIATNKTPAGRAMNRRVELIIFRKKR